MTDVDPTVLCGARKFWGDGWDAEGWLEHFATPGAIPPGMINEAFCRLPAGHSEQEHEAFGDWGALWWPVEHQVLGEFWMDE